MAGNVCEPKARRGQGIDGLDISNFMSGQSLVPREQTSDPRVLTTDPQEAQNIPLSRGQYRIQGFMKKPEEGFKPTFLTNISKAIKTNDEAKRVHFYKIEFLPTDRKIDGHEVVRFTVVVHVIDNPAFVVPLIWAAGAVGTTVGGWFLVDKVESFTETGTGKLLTLTAAAATIFVAFNFFGGK